MSTPEDKKLYDQVKKKYMKSILNILLIDQVCWFKNIKKRGGAYKGKENKSSGLNRWFNENGLTNVVKLVIRINRMCIDLLLRLTKTRLQHLKT